MLKEINILLEFWFGTEVEPNKIIETQSTLWWGKCSDLDQKIEELFLIPYEQAINGELNHWLQTPAGQLALILLLDQFSRVLNRNSGKAFSQDNKALNIALAGIENNFDKLLRPIERVFYYMPLEHSEDINTQNKSIELFSELLNDVPVELKKQFHAYLDFAEQHRVIIEQFNRFPHRNNLLNRTSSPEELLFLQENGSSF